MVGDVVGVEVGDVVGDGVGDVVGEVVGDAVGANVGTRVGAAVGGMVHAPQIAGQESRIKASLHWITAINSRQPSGSGGC